MRIPKLILLLSVLTAVGVLMAGCGGTKTAISQTEYQVVNVQRGTISVEVTSTGNLVYAERELLAFAANGTVGNVFVEVGDEVKKNDVLATLDKEEWDKQLTTLGNNLTLAKRQPPTKELDLKVAEMNLQTAQDNLNAIQDVQTAQKELDDAKYRQSINEAMLRQAVIEGGTATTNYWSREIAAEKVKVADAQKKLNDVLAASSTAVTTNVATQIASRKLGIEQAQKKVDDARTAIEDANKAVADAQKALDDWKATEIEIKAPFDGVVTAVSTVKGATVKKGTTAITMADTSRFEVEMLVSEIDVLKVNLGTTATIELSALSGVTFPAKVITIAPVATIQQGVVNYKVKAEMTITKATPSATTSAPSTEEEQQAREMVDNAIAKAVKDGRLTQTQADQLKVRFSQFIEVMTAEQIDQMITRFAQGGPVAGGQAGTGSGRIGQAAGNLTPAQLDQLRQRAQQGQLGGQSTNGIVPETVQLREGLSVTTNLLIQQKANVLLVPNQAISVKGGKSYVLVSKDDGTREEREVTTGLSDWKNTEVVSGLTTGDKIAIAKTTGTSTSKTTQPTQGIFGGGGGIRIPR